MQQDGNGFLSCAAVLVRVHVQVVECFRLGCPLDEQQQAQAQGPRFVITAVMVFYEAVC